jgi:hypothetical protein
MNARFFTDRNRHSVHVIAGKETIPNNFIEIFPYLLNRQTGKRIAVVAEDDNDPNCYYYWADKNTHINLGYLRHGEPWGYKLIWMNKEEIAEENKLEAMIERHKLETPRVNV